MRLAEHYERKPEGGGIGVLIVRVEISGWGAGVRGTMEIPSDDPIKRSQIPRRAAKHATVPGKCPRNFINALLVSFSIIVLYDPQTPPPQRTTYPVTLRSSLISRVRRIRKHFTSITGVFGSDSKVKFRVESVSFDDNLVKGVRVLDVVESSRATGTLIIWVTLYIGDKGESVGGGIRGRWGWWFLKQRCDFVSTVFGVVVAFAGGGRTGRVTFWAPRTRKYFEKSGRNRRGERLCHFRSGIRRRVL